MPTISAECNSAGTDRSELVNIVRETRRYRDLLQAKFAAKSGVSFQSVNYWGNGRAKPLLIALKQIEQLLHQMGDAGKDLITQYFSG